jgi:hypothetical protein
MGEHRFNPVVKYLSENSGVLISSQEVKRMRNAARSDAIDRYFEKNPRKLGRLLDGGWIIRGMRKERDKKELGRYFQVKEF